MAQDFGAGEFNRLRTILTNSLFLSAVVTVLMVAAGYMRVMVWGIPLTMLYNFLASVLRAACPG